jgi:multidrug resistance efflux pump
MKRRIVFLLVLLLIGSLLAVGWWWARNYPGQARQFLLDRGLAADQAAQIISWAGGQPTAEENRELRASGSIEGDAVSIVSELGGQIAGLSVEEGDEVEAGQVLVLLDTTVLQAQMAQAEAAIAAARANLEEVKAGTHPAEILAAEAAAQQAIAQRDAAKKAWEDAQAILDNPQQIEAQIVQAQAAVDLAAVQIEQARAQISAAEAERDQYQAQGSLEEKGMYRIYQYQVKAAQAALEAAKTNKTGADKALAALQALRRNPLALISQVHLAEQQARMAEAGVAVAEAKLAELRAGPTSEQVAVEQARVTQAEAAASGLQVQSDKRTLRSPISGIVTSRAAHAGEAAVAGATLLTIANLDEVRLTVYIPEDELGHVYLGQQVWVEVDSFPGQFFPGTASYIAQEAEFTPMNVQTEKDRVNMVFAVRIRLPNPDHLLKPGMPADVVIGN